MMAAEVQKLGLIETLPDEILVFIFSKLQLTDLLLCVRRVCVRWLRLSKDESLWKEIDFSFLCMGSEHKDKEKNSDGVERLFHEVASFVEKIVFSNVSFSTEVLELFGPSKDCKSSFDFEKLKCLDYSYSAIGSPSLNKALSIQPQLQELILVHTNISYTVVMSEVIHLPCLKKLVVHDLNSWDCLLDHRQESRRMHNKRITIQVSQHCPDLEWVELYSIWTDLDNSVIQNFTKNCPKLTRLYLTWSSNTTCNAFINAEACSKITHLGFVDRQEREPYLHIFLPFFPNLISLVINGRNVHTDDCTTLSNYCPKLQELIFDFKSMRDHDCLFDFYFHKNDSLSGRNLQIIVEGCRKLRKIHAPCSQIHDDSVLRMSLNCRLLEDVNFMHCPLLSIQSLVALAENCPNLKYANFQHTFNPHDYLQVFLSKCPLLQEINFDRSISDLTSFTDMSPLQASGSSPCEFGLNPIYDIDDYPTPSTCPCSGLSYDLDHDLPFIDMKNSHHPLGDSIITDDNDVTSLELPVKNISLEDIADVNYNPVRPNHCHIQKLSLINSNISDKVLQEIFSFCPDITHLVLDGCLSLTNETVITLVKCCRHLKILMMSAKQIDSSEVGDSSLIEMTKYSRDLEALSILYNRNITHVGIYAIFRALDSTLRKLRTLSFCVGPHYGCKVPLKPPYGFHYLTEQTQFCIGDEVSPDFRILHLEFKERRTI